MQLPEYIEAKRVQMTLLSLRGYAHEHAGLSAPREEQS